MGEFQCFICPVVAHGPSAAGQPVSRFSCRSLPIQGGFQPVCKLFSSTELQHVCTRPWADNVRSHCRSPDLDRVASEFEFVEQKITDCPHESSWNYLRGLLSLPYVKQQPVLDQMAKVSLQVTSWTWHNDSVSVQHLSHPL